MKYILMHREKSVAVLDMNSNNGSINRVDEVLDEEHLPIGIKRDKRYIARELDRWFSGRSIPASRSGFRQALEDMEIRRGIQLSASELLMQCYGLSLSDQYWVKPVDTPLEWKQINFYNNSFSDDVGNFLFGQIVEQGMLDLVSPCNTSDGWLQKKWKIINGQRVLIKGGSGMLQQEPFNEAVATAVCRRLHIPHVHYLVMWDNGKPYSACANMTTDRQDLISALSIYSTDKKPNHLSAYNYFLNRCKALGISDAENSLAQMVVLDFLICNTDRHFGNFGAVRDAVTLEWQGIAPVFDSGTSMWQDCYTNRIHPRADVAAKPFCSTHREQLKLVADNLAWLDFSAMRGLEEEVRSIYEQARFGEANRAAVLSRAIAERCDYLQELVQEISPPVVSIQDICKKAASQAEKMNVERGGRKEKQELEQTK